MQSEQPFLLYSGECESEGRKGVRKNGRGEKKCRKEQVNDLNEATKWEQCRRLKIKKNDFFGQFKRFREKN